MTRKGVMSITHQTFSELEISDEQLEQAKELDKELQVYLEGYFNHNRAFAASADVSSSTSAGLQLIGDEIGDDLPFWF